MPKEKFMPAESAQDQTPMAATNDAAPVEEVVPVEVVEEWPAAPSEPQKIKAMNVSATLLQLDDGNPFAPRAIAELTQAEFDRFDRLKLIAPK